MAGAVGERLSGSCDEKLKFPPNPPFSFSLCLYIHKEFPSVMLFLRALHAFGDFQVRSSPALSGL
jgi:hypothetical protein